MSRVYNEPVFRRQSLVIRWACEVAKALDDCEFHDHEDGVKLLREVVALLPPEECK